MALHGALCGGTPYSILIVGGLSKVAWAANAVGGGVAGGVSGVFWRGGEGAETSSSLPAAAVRYSLRCAREEEEGGGRGRGKRRKRGRERERN